MASELRDRLAEAIHEASCQRERLYCEGRCEDIAERLLASEPMAGLVAAARLAIDILPDLSAGFHQVGSIRDHADPNDRTGWNVHGIETCEDVYCVEARDASDALRAALDG